MCGKYGGPAELEVFAGYFKVPPPFAKIEAIEEFRTMRMVKVMAKNAKGGYVIKDMHWGLVPASHTGHVKDWFRAYHTYHAQLEEVAMKPAFQNAWFRKRRVLLPMERYFEKTKAKPNLFGNDGGLIRVAISRADDKPLAVAGLYDYAQTADGPFLSVAMLTRAPGNRMMTIHGREPVVVEPENWQAWLDGSDDIDLTTPWRDDAFTVETAA